MNFPPNREQLSAQNPRLLVKYSRPDESQPMSLARSAVIREMQRIQERLVVTSIRLHDAEFDASSARMELDTLNRTFDELHAVLDKLGVAENEE